MNKVFKMVIAVVAGVLLASMVIGLVDMLNRYLYPSDLLHPDMKQQRDLIESAPLPEKILVLAGFILSGFFGGYFAARIAPETKKLLCASAVGFVLLLFVIFYIILFPLPMWFMVMSCMLIIPASLAGGRIAGKPNLHARQE